MTPSGWLSYRHLSLSILKIGLLIFALNLLFPNLPCQEGVGEIYSMGLHVSTACSLPYSSCGTHFPAQGRYWYQSAEEAVMPQLEMTPNSSDLEQQSLISHSHLCLS